MKVELSTRLNGQFGNPKHFNFNLIKVTKERSKNILFGKIVVVAKSWMVSVDKLVLNAIFRDSGAT